MRWTVGVVLLLIASGACTPINQVKRMDGQEEPDGGSNKKAKDTDAATEMTQEATPEKTGVGKVVTQSTPCSDEGARACEGHGVREVSICKGGKWEADTPCKMNERCDSRQGKCAPVAAVCAGQEAGAEFCDGDKRMVCDDLVAARENACGANELCSRKDGKVSCTCAPGAVPAASGMGCEVVSGCDSNGSGCDPLTRCISNGCTPCPAGYVGDGRKGCVPQLETLSVQCGSSAARKIELTSGVYEYRASVPMLCQSAKLTAAGPADTQIEVDGKSLESGATWSSPLLHTGDNAVKIVITARSGRSSSYQVKIERAGSKCDYLKASNAGAQDSFGFGIAADGNRLLIGAPFEASDGSSPDNNSLRNSGAAYVFELDGDKWAEKQLIKAPQPSESDMFGASVAISGDVLVVGAPRYNLMLFKIVPPTGPGTAYVFRREGGVWKQDGQLNPSEGSGADMFGFHVSVHGETVLVGAPYDSTGGSHAGAVYSFTKTNGTWSQQQKIIPKAPVAEASFGNSNALEKDLFVAGAMQDPTAADAAGSAYVFARDAAGMWIEQERLQAPSPKALATFGMNVQLNNGRVLVTAPGLDLRQRQTPAGEAYLFELDAASGKRIVTARLKGAMPHSVDLFGGSAALTSNAIMIGANGDNSSSRGIDGDPSRNDAELAGAAYVFGLQGTEYVQTTYIKAFNAEAQDNFGHSMAATESFLAVAAPFEGSAERGVHTQDDANASSNAAQSSGVVYVYR